MLVCRNNSSLGQTPTVLDFRNYVHEPRNAQVVNTGNVELEKVDVWNTTVADNCQVVDHLAVRANFSCSGDYALTWVDITSGRVENVVQ